MEFTKRSIEKFGTLYLKNFGEKLTDEELIKKAGYLLELYRVVYATPHSGEVFDNKKESNEQ